MELGRQTIFGTTSSVLPDPALCAVEGGDLSAYTDQNTAINLDTGNVVPANKVKAYSLWDLAFSYDVSQATRLRAGVQNVFNTMPPFSNQAYYFLASYDPTYTDPRGRSFYASISHSLR